MPTVKESQMHFAFTELVTTTVMCVAKTLSFNKPVEITMLCATTICTDQGILHVIHPRPAETMVPLVVLQRLARTKVLSVEITKSSSLESVTTATIMEPSAVILPRLVETWWSNVNQSKNQKIRLLHVILARTLLKVKTSVVDLTPQPVETKVSFASMVPIKLWILLVKENAKIMELSAVTQEPVETNVLHVLLAVPTRVEIFLAEMTVCTTVTYVVNQKFWLATTWVLNVTMDYTLINKLYVEAFSVILPMTKMPNIDV
jgi:hypothetical protein